ncbi:Plus-3 [Kalmanozyma brasiliensis GHG001]|uniref:Plus3 domain-containing protein n=1 Tax=Kalmanozyma brasiliensis (strain GHG001) TaxID=1365824 RepID=V5EXK4_KALBG|nr:Plus-3 [Kalmanozyma brasiliensis GHG001]EST07224.1 Plus-3 [Kalmanozyma brasiliensis GHG001]
MAGGGLDDELLELAGGSARQIDLSSDDEGDRVRTGSKRDSKPSTSSSLAKKRRLDLLDESASGSDADAPGSDDDAAGSSADERGDPYPYHGIYKSARDMEQLMAMNELEREDILARRRDEINTRRQKSELAALVRAQKAAAGATKKAVSKKRVVRGGRGGRKGADSDLSEQSEDDDEDEEEDADGDSDFAYGGAATAAKSRKKKLPGQTDAKSAKLSELRKKRQQKAAGVSRTAGLDSDDDAAAAPSKSRRRGYASSDDEVSYSDYSDEDDYPRRSRPSKPDLSSSRDSSDPPTLADLNAARITRDNVESRLYAPRFREALIGGFIRYNWGTRPSTSNPGRTETVYRIHQITDVHEAPGKFYDLSDDRSGKWCNVYLTFEHDGEEHQAKINMLSRGEFSESERERWIAFVKAKGNLPGKGRVGRKADELEKFFTSPLTEADIKGILETKKRLRTEAESVMGKSVDGPRGGLNTPGVATPTAAGGDVQPQSLEARLAAVNERNRALDRSKQSDVERKARNNKLAAFQAAKAQQQREERQAQQGEVKDGEADGGVQLTNEKVGHTGMGNGFVAVKNYATLVEVDLGDF